MTRINVVKPHMPLPSFDLPLDTALLGRDSLNGVVPDVIIPHPSVSRHHARLRKKGDLYTIQDLDSTNHTWVNGNLLEPGPEAVLEQHSYFQLGEVLFLVSYEENGEVSTQTVVDAYLQSPVPPSGRFRVRSSIIVGRSAECDIVLLSPLVSSRHASLTFVGGVGFARDLGSANGTFVNGELITMPTPLKPGDTVMVGMTKLRFDGHTLLRFDEQGSIRIDAQNLEKTVIGPQGPLCILQKVSLQIKPRELVAIVGQSGTGKSTLMKALSGNMSYGGSVLYNGWNLETSRQAFAGSIGYVTQDDIIHIDLTVTEALSFAAELRLSPDVSREERAHRVEEVLEIVDLRDRRDFVIRQLSGGQRKRVNVGVELLSDPSVLFLDEPASGLDPLMEAQLMSMLRKTADSGRTVVMVTHATQSLGLVDTVICMGHGGNLCFIGSPDEALEFFACEDFASIYGKIGHTSNEAERLSREFASSRYCNKQVYTSSGQADVGDSKVAGLPNRVHPTAKSSFARQLATLARRYATIISRDRRYLALLLAQSPILALIIVASMKFDRFVLATDLKSNSEVLALGPLDLMMPKFLALLLVISMIWMGISSSAREIVKERSILRRERMVSLGIPAYLASKLTVLASFSVVQAILMVAVLSLFIKLDHPGFAGYGSFCGVLCLLGFAGVGIGLLLSSLSSSSDQAAGLVTLLVLPQIALCGGIIPMDKPGLREVSALVTANWGYNATVRSLGLVEYYDELLETGNGSPEISNAVIPLRADIEKKYETPPSVSHGLIATYCVVGIIGAGLALRRNIKNY